jgi:integrase
MKNSQLHVCRGVLQLRSGLVDARTKTESSDRWVDVPEITMTALMEHREKQEKDAQKRIEKGKPYEDQGLIFTQPDGSPLRPDSLSNNFFRVRDKAKLPKGVTLHTLRHTFASHLIDSGESITEVSKALGHSNIRTTLGMYTHRISRRQVTVADRMQELLTRKDTPKKSDGKDEDAPTKSE